MTIEPDTPRTKRLIIAVSFGMVGILTIWSFFNSVAVLDNVSWLQSIIQIASLPVVALVMMLSEQVHSLSHVGVYFCAFLIWSFVGYMLAVILVRKR